MLQGLFEHKAKVPSLLNPATHTFKMASWADNASVGEGDMGTNVVWMYPQLWQPKGDHKHEHKDLCADGMCGAAAKYDKYNTHMGMPGH